MNISTEFEISAVFVLTYGLERDRCTDAVITNCLINFIDRHKMAVVHTLLSTAFVELL